MVQTGTVNLVVPSKGSTTDAVDDLAWVFYGGAAFAAAAASKVVFVMAGSELYDSSRFIPPQDPNKYSGLASGVRWKIAGAVSLGANSA
jgi:hypothetical protein